MPFVTLSLPPTNVPYSQSTPPFGNWGGGQWASGISAGIQMAGLAKTQLEGFNIFQRVSRTYQQNTTSVSSPNFLIPYQVRANDFMLAQITTVSGTTITTPGGWNLIRSDTAAAGTGPVTQSIYYKYAAGTAGQFSTECGTSVTFTLSNTAQWAAANLMVYGGVALTSPIHVQGATNGNSATATAGALTTTIPNTWVIQMVGTDYTSTGMSYTMPTAGYTYRSTNGHASGPFNISNVASAAQDIFQAAAGTTGTPAITLAFSTSWVLQTIALVPTTSGANAFPTPTATPVSGGSLASGTAVYYRISALSWSNNGAGETLPCPEITATPSGANLSVQLSWTAVPNAYGYRIYGRATGAEIPLATVVGQATTTYTDTGAATPSGVLNTVDTSADSGQIAFGCCWNISTPANFGYEIFQFTDSLQATYPVLIRIEYRNTGSGMYNPNLLMVVGTATTGAGIITYAPQFYNSQSSNANNFLGTSTNVSWYASSYSNIYFESDGGSSLTIAGWINPPGTGSPGSSGLIGMVERTRDWDGTPNGEGVAIVWGGSGYYQNLVIANANIFTSSAQTTTNPTNAIVVALPVTPATLATIGTTIYVFPLLGPNTPRLNAPSKHLVMLYPGDVALAGTFSITIYGSARTYQRHNYGMGSFVYAFRSAL